MDEKQMQVTYGSIRSPKYYNDAREAFSEKLTRSKKISVAVSGTKSKHRIEYWSSLLFTRMVITGITILKISPDRKSISKKPQIWDFGSVASLSRNLFENYLYFYYLCADNMSDNESSYRQLLLYIRENRARIKLKSEFAEISDYEEFEQAQAKLVAELRLYDQFQNLSEKKQNELIRGDKLPYIQDEIVKKIGLNTDQTRVMYRLFSQYVHSSPISFSRIEKEGRGDGEENPIDRGYTGVALFFGAMILEFANADMQRLHRIQ